MTEATTAKLERMARSLRLQAELVAVLRLLEDADVATLVLKGIPLARRVFGSIEAREMLDNDILIHSKDVDKAVRLLRERGFEPTIERSVDDEKRSGEFRYPLARRLPDGSRTLVELHWNAFPPALNPVPESVLWRRSEPFDLGGAHTLVFDRAMTLIHLASHYGQHRFTEEKILRDVATAWNLWHDEIDTEDLLVLAREHHLEHLLDFSLLAAQDLGLLTAPPPEIKSPRARRLRRLLKSERLHEERPHPDYVRQSMRAILVEPRLVGRWIKDQAFPPIERMAQIYGRDVSPTLYLRYVTRLAQPVTRAVARRRETRKP